MTLKKLVEKINETQPTWYDNLPEDTQEAFKNAGLENMEFRHTGTKYKLECLMQEHGIELEDLCNTPTKIILAMFDMNAVIDDNEETLEGIRIWKEDCPI